MDLIEVSLTSVVHHRLTVKLKSDPIGDPIWIDIDKTTSDQMEPE